jgi:hypothetical protein
MLVRGGAAMQLNELVECLDDPVLFSTMVLHHRVWEPTQAELMRAVRDHNRVLCLSGHSLGKSWAAADLLLWMLARGGCVLTSSASQRQVVSIVWRAVKSTLSQAQPPELNLGMCNQAALQLSPDCWAMGFSSGSEDKGARFQGYKFPGEGLIILDEAMALDAEVFEAIESTRAGGSVHVLILANPTIAAGPVYELARSGSYHTIQISCFDSPNFRYRDFTLEKLRSLPPGLPDHSPEFEFDPAWPMLAKPAWAYQLLHQYGGEDSPVFGPRVCGTWPVQSADSLISLNWVNEAVKRWQETPKGDSGEPVSIGADIARYGTNESVAVVVPVRCTEIEALAAWADRVTRWGFLRV